jgi:hypothetical protein
VLTSIRDICSHVRFFVNHHRHEAVLTACLTHDAAPVGVAHGNELADGIERRPDIACLFGNDHQAIGRGVVGEHDPEAIEDTAARRCH